MPTDEFGDKWACEPCIRGHRSTKCEHFDRFMMRVKRPGRPLSTCPHTKTQCTCGTEKVIMIRIPKGSGCHCTRAPTYPAISDRTILENPQSTLHQTPTNPPLAPAPVAVTSPTHQPAHQPHEASTERRAVPYPSEFDRPKLGLINPQHHSRFPNTTQTVITSEGQRGGQDDGFRGRHLPSASESNSHGILHALDEPDLETSSFPMPASGSRIVSIQQPHSGSDVRVSNVRDSDSSFREQAPIDERVKESSSQNKKSCCCSTASEHTSPIIPAKPSKTDMFPIHDENTRHLSYHPPRTMQINKFLEKGKTHDDTPFPQSTLSFQPHPVPHTTVYSMPATYATAENPLTQRQQAYFQQNGHFYSQNVPHYASLGVVGSAAPSAEGNAILSLTHSCTCGPSCQCVFCVTHPYNATTRDRVQTLAHLLPDDTDYVPKSPIQASYRPAFQSNSESSPMGTATNRMHINEILHPSDLSQPTPFSPSDFGNEIYPNGTLSEVTQPAISSSGYLTMEYEYDSMDLGQCTDATGTCRCGDDCTCIGCWTHSGHEE